MADPSVLLRLPLNQFSITASSVVDQSGKIPDELKHLYSAKDTWSRYGSTHTPVHIRLSDPRTKSTASGSDLVVFFGSQNTQIWDLDLQPCLAATSTEQSQAEYFRLAVVFNGDGAGLKVMKRYSVAQPHWREITKVALDFGSLADMHSFITCIRSICTIPSTGKLSQRVTIRSSAEPRPAASVPANHNSSSLPGMAMLPDPLQQYAPFDAFSQLPDFGFTQTQAFRDIIGTDTATLPPVSTTEANVLTTADVAQFANPSAIDPTLSSTFDFRYQQTNALAGPSSPVLAPFIVADPPDRIPPTVQPGEANDTRIAKKYLPIHISGLAAASGSAAQPIPASKPKAKPKAAATTAKRAATKSAAAARKNINSDASDSQQAVKKPRKAATAKAAPAKPLKLVEIDHGSDLDEQIQPQSTQAAQLPGHETAPVSTSAMPAPQATPHPHTQSADPLLNAQYALAAMQAMNLNNLMQVGAAHPQQMPWSTNSQAMPSGLAGGQMPFWPQPGMPYGMYGAQPQMQWGAGQFGQAAAPASGSGSLPAQTQVSVPAAPVSAPAVETGSTQANQTAKAGTADEVPQEVRELAALLAAVNAGTLSPDVPADDDRARTAKMIDSICHALYPTAGDKAEAPAAEDDIGGVLKTLSSDEEKQLLLRIILNDRDDFAGFVERVAQLT